MSLSQLAEARMQEYLRRPPEARTAEPLASGSPLDVPLEVQLMQDITALDRVAVCSTDANERARAEAVARDLALRLAVVLETTGRPLLALHWFEQRAAQKQALRDGATDSSG